MKKVILTDGTIINNCTDSTTSNEIYALKDSYGDAGAVRDLFTTKNSSTIVVKDENDDIVAKGINLVLMNGATIIPENDKFICIIKTRIKTETEIMKDEIAELQEVVIGG